MSRYCNIRNCDCSKLGNNLCGAVVSYNTRTGRVKMNIKYKPESDRKKRMPSPEAPGAQDALTYGVDLSLIPTCSSRDITSGKRKLEDSPPRQPEKKTKLNVKEANDAATDDSQMWK